MAPFRQDLSKAKDGKLVGKGGRTQTLGAAAQRRAAPAPAKPQTTVLQAEPPTSVSLPLPAPRRGGPGVPGAPSPDPGFNVNGGGRGPGGARTLEAPFGGPMPVGGIEGFLARLRGMPMPSGRSGMAPQVPEAEPNWDGPITNRGPLGPMPPPMEAGELPMEMGPPNVVQPQPPTSPFGRPTGKPGVDSNAFATPRPRAGGGGQAARIGGLMSRMQPRTQLSY